MHRGRSIRPLLVVLVAAGSLLVLTDWPADAATGDKVATIIADRTGTACASTNADGDHGSVGVGVAFDGTNLWFSCYGDNTLTVVRPSDGSQVKVVTVTGTGELGALAYDGMNDILYACGEESVVGIVDVDTGAFSDLFDSAGCFDGLAYDGEDDTIWSSADATSTVQHYSITGTQLSSTSVTLGSCGNSGLAVGGSDLFLGNNGCSEIYKSDKDLSDIELFIDTSQTEGRRVEDLECDNLTFASTDQAVIWSVDAYDNIMNAYEIPEGTCFFGGGVPPTTSTTPTTSTSAPTTTTTTPPAPPAAAVQNEADFTG